MKLYLLIKIDDLHVPAVKNGLYRKSLGKAVLTKDHLEANIPPGSPVLRSQQLPRGLHEVERGPNPLTGYGNDYIRLKRSRLGVAEGWILRVGKQVAELMTEVECRNRGLLTRAQRRQSNKASGNINTK